MRAYDGRLRHACTDSEALCRAWRACHRGKTLILGFLRIFSSRFWISSGWRLVPRGGRADRRLTWCQQPASGVRTRPWRRRRWYVHIFSIIGAGVGDVQKCRRDGGGGCSPMTWCCRAFSLFLSSWKAPMKARRRVLRATISVYKHVLQGARWRAWRGRFFNATTRNGSLSSQQRYPWVHSGTSGPSTA